jgi:hypothetical protein
MMGERRVMQEALFYGFRRTRRRPRTRADRWSRCRRRSIEPPEKPTIIVPSAKERPAFVGLALDIGFRRLALASSELKSCSRPWSVETLRATRRRNPVSWTTPEEERPTALSPDQCR